MTGLVKKEAPGLIRFYLNGKEIAVAEVDANEDWFLVATKEDGTVQAGYVDETQVIEGVCSVFPEWEKQYIEHYDEVQEELV